MGNHDELLDRLVKELQGCNLEELKRVSEQLTKKIGAVEGKERQRGIGRIYQFRGDWWADLAYDKKRRRRRIGRVGIMEKGRDQNKRQAELVLEQWRKKIEAERWHELDDYETKKIEAEVEASKRKFSDLADEFEKGYAIPSVPSWQESGKGCLENVKEYFGNKNAEEISRQDILDYQISRRKEVSPSRVNQEIGVICQCFNYAKEFLSFKGQNPAEYRGKTSALKRLKTKKRKQYLKPDDIAKFLEHADPEIRDYFLVAITTGMRQDEMALISERRVNMDKSYFQLFAHETKTKEDRKVPLCEIAKAAIKRRNFDFTRDIMRTPKKYPFGAALRQAGFKAGRNDDPDSICWHDLRRTFAKLFDGRGLSTEHRKQIMGHSIGEVAETYIPADIETLVADVRKLDIYLREFMPEGISVFLVVQAKIEEKSESSQTIVK